ncbi:MAG: ribosome silencing factor [Nitrospiraceae bacterium]|nr:ribosome silencing factor [Nitrospiraceae bacterium]
MNPRSKALEAAQAAIETKARDIVIFEVGELTTIADYMVICSAQSHRQVQAVMRHVENRLKNLKTLPQSIEGTEAAVWILMDYGDIMVHIFTNDIREYYGLDSVWGDAPSQVFENEPSTMAAGRTMG